MALARGNNAHGQTSGASLAVNLTAASGALIMVGVTSNGAPVTGITSGNGETFTFHGAGGNGASEEFEFWYTETTSAWTANAVTVSTTLGAFLCVDAVEYTGHDSANIFDDNASIPDEGADMPRTVSTDLANTVIIGGCRMNGTSNPTAGTGFTTVSGANFTLFEEKFVTATQSSLSVDVASGTSNGGVATAIREASAGGDVTVTPGAGDLTLTGKAPAANLIVRSTVTLGAGDLVLTGKAPSVAIRVRFTVAPGKGDLVLTGKAPTVVVQAETTQTVTPGKGDLVLTGKAPTATLVLRFTVAPDKGDLVLTGKAPSVSVGVAGQILVTPGVGRLTLTGKAPEVSVSSPDVSVQPGVGGGQGERRTPFTGRGFFEDSRSEEVSAAPEPEQPAREATPDAAQAPEVVPRPILELVKPEDDSAALAERRDRLEAARQRAVLEQDEARRLIEALERSLEDQDALVERLEFAAEFETQALTLLLDAVVQRRKTVIRAAIERQQRRLAALEQVTAEVVAMTQRIRQDVARAAIVEAQKLEQVA